MKKAKMPKTAKQNTDYIIAPKTRRSRFQSNNSAALVHGGFSSKIAKELLSSILDNDLGFELGVLKGQLSNITLLGQELITRLITEGEDSVALSVVLSCADRTAKLVPQIHKVLDSSFAQTESTQVIKSRNRWLNKLYKGKCSASDVAYQFEVHQLGELPDYVQQMLSIELSAQQTNTDHENLSREQIFEKLEDYKVTIASEEEQIKLRQLAVSKEKQRINQQLFSYSESSEDEN
ncbi:hypothetical protein [Shewanella japonica]|uniref:hypothetical protein n=1 Tax=Shewanella japonica TaxID=93973 RepID=UPI0024944ECC|nr:hypothetical protein [Shewanella japonica]